MSRLKELIEELCPEGVEWKKLIDYVDVLYGYPFDSRLFSEDSSLMPLIRIRDVKPAKSSTYYSGAPIEEYIIKRGDILVGMDGNFNLEKWDDIDGLLNQRVCKLTSKDEKYVLNGFIYHYLKPVFKSIEGELNSGTVIHLSAKRINKIEIPVPPLPVQEEIVRILDKFTTLEAELEAELDCRKRQYEFYRNQLLSFDKVGGASSEVQWVKLGDMCDIRGRIGFRGYTRRDLVEESEGAISLSPSNILDGVLSYDKCTYVSWEKYNESPEIMASVGDIVFTKTASVGKTALIKKLPKETTINPQLVLLKNIKCDRGYLSYILKGDRFQSEVRKITGVGSVPNVSQSALSNILIPVPPLSEQQRIVSILDRFEALTTDLQSGLPAEIEARRKQYEYYREQLLTFKRKSA